MIPADRLLNSAPIAIGCSHGSAYSMMHDHFKFQKVCSLWVSRELSDEHKMNQIELSLQHHCRYGEEVKDMPDNIVIGDESYVHHYQIESDDASMQWKHTFLPVAKKLKVMLSTGNVTLTVFLDCF